MIRLGWFGGPLLAPELLVGQLRESFDDIARIGPCCGGRIRLGAEGLTNAVTGFIEDGVKPVVEHLLPGLGRRAESQVEGLHEGQQVSHRCGFDLLELIEGVLGVGHAEHPDQPGERLHPLLGFLLISEFRQRLFLEFGAEMIDQGIALVHRLR